MSGSQTREAQEQCGSSPMLSSDIAAATAIGASPTPISVTGQPAERRRYLFGPWVDFFCLGGASLLVLPLVALLPESDYREPLAGLMMLAAMFVNHPHFVHSYQIFYRNFRAKAFGMDYDRALRRQYIVAGLVVPLLLILFFAVCLGHGEARVLGYGANAMALLVGWHYVKQGYGMLMVDAALKRRFFTDADKRVLLANSYAVWALAWLMANSTIRSSDLWGLTYYTFGIPDWLVSVAAVVAVVTGLRTAFMLVRRWRANGGSLPVNGVAAYLVTLYAWVLFVRLSPLWLFVVPALHSLQYLVVVYRFESNSENHRLAATAGSRLSVLQRLFTTPVRVHMTGFVLVGIVLGFAGFFGLPMVLQAIAHYDRAVFGPTLFIFVFWIFINVHHYFLDSVMWRRENPEARKFLFS
jgi:hypothetical protein